MREIRNDNNNKRGGIKGKPWMKKETPCFGREKRIFVRSFPGFAHYS
jgi:hypothetical protein